MVLQSFVECYWKQPGSGRSSLPPLKCNRFSANIPEYQHNINVQILSSCHCVLVRLSLHQTTLSFPRHTITTSGSLLLQSWVCKEHLSKTLSKKPVNQL